jgi:hypothetical protein
MMKHKLDNTTFIGKELETYCSRIEQDYFFGMHSW